MFQNSGDFNADLAALNTTAIGGNGASKDRLRRCGSSLAGFISAATSEDPSKALGRMLCGKRKLYNEDVLPRRACCEACHQTCLYGIADRDCDNGNGFCGALCGLGPWCAKCRDDIHRQLCEHLCRGVQLVRTAISAQIHVSEILTFHIVQFAQLQPERIPAR
jgi:hypothetical protein